MQSETIKPIAKGPQFSGSSAAPAVSDSRVRPIAKKLSATTPQSVVKAVSIRAALRDIHMFRECSAEELDHVAAIAVVHALQRGDTLFQQGDPALGFYVVMQGTILLYSMNIDGKEQISLAFRENDVFGESTLHGMEYIPLTARAFEQSIVVLIPRNPFLQLITRHSGIALSVVAAMAMRLDRLTERLADMKIHDVEQRFLVWISQRIPPQAVTINIHLGIKHLLASEIGTSSETLSRLLARLKKKDLVTLKGRMLSIKDCQAFRDYVYQESKRRKKSKNLAVENE